ncbi:MAG: ATP-binding protein [Anaerolineaceae bacterium]|nr:ATP-binding protein [Anaerolineaceae bacterium]
MNHFTHSLQHILAELTRLDILLRVQVWRARQLAGAEDQLHAFYIPEEEVDVLLEKPIGLARWTAVPLPEETATHIQTTLDEMVLALEQRRAASKEQGILLRLDYLTDACDLTQFDRHVLLIALAPEIDLSYQRLYAYLHDDVTRKHPSVDLALNLLCPTLDEKLAQRHRFAPGAPLCQHELIELSGDGVPPLLGQALWLNPRIAAYLLDGDAPDGRLAPYITLTNNPTILADLPLPENLVQPLERLLATRNPAESTLFYLQGSYGAGKRPLANAIAHHQGQALLTVNGRALARLPHKEFSALVPLLLREARLQNAALLWTDFDALLSDVQTGLRETVLTMLNGHPGLILLAGEAPWEPGGVFDQSRYQRLRLPTPTTAQRESLWAIALATTPHQLAPADLADIAANFRLTPGQIADAARTAFGLAQWRQPNAPDLTHDDLIRASRRHSNRQLTDLAQKITPHYQWNDIVLPPPQLTQLRELCDQVKYSGLVYQTWGFDRKLAMGKGVNALFSGPPGTGKTMAADIIACELGLDLYKIDLSTVVSKFIGETEKNLSRIFAEAETSNAILFFDEADALFGKRTEVRDAHDRYANLEISYLLQKMEQYTGIVILASNLRKNMDEAFVRRLHYIVEFPFPGPAERQRIWQGVWPDELPRSGTLDMNLLANQIEVAGGSIRNVAVTAAFLAAADGGTVTMAHLVQATQREYQKMGKMLTNTDKLLTSS